MDTDAILSLLKDVAEEVIVPRFRDLADGEVTEKNPGDLVTVADQQAEVLITRALSAAYPGAVILGEEAHETAPSLMAAYLGAEHAFTVDPVDGTKNFVHGSPDHAVMVAETRFGTAVRGWIWQPQHNRAYVAELGAGAYRDGERLTRPAPPADPAALRGVTSLRAQVGAKHGRLAALELTWVCCGVDYPKLVEGEADFIVYGRSRPWDHAPGTLLLTEAGGFAGDGRGETYRAGSQPERLLAAADRASYEAVRPELAQVRGFGPGGEGS
ncbi:inositol monophosphatase family protein [Ornithinicoccus hortensis]|uniref:Fructose-1,6-bisphosphatase/inositol monophosphatase family enzyme n=1 Tax=Ornithinicoccus hortensis TaxID=82346 RepID=A0A542YTL9_9MICO|nr:inositol monophosphatase [Ornithinicoccus hortensis]TQL51440.1 fructose-1,6-bisphosphatase/inositol monophosphatase family enzyme [Ornithinicoccus hortensis]